MLIVSRIFTMANDEYLPQVDPYIKKEAKDENNKVG